MKYAIQGVASNMYARYTFRETVLAENREQAESKAIRKAKGKWAMGLTITITEIREV